MEAFPHSHRPTAALKLAKRTIFDVWCSDPWWARNRPAQASQNIKLIPLTTEPGVEQKPSLSPDGSQVAYSWNGPDQTNFDIYVKTTKAGAAVAAPPLRLTRDPADDTNPVWSPDGSSIAFLRKSDVGNQCGLMLMPALGRRERPSRSDEMPVVRVAGLPKK